MSMLSTKIQQLIDSIVNTSGFGKNDGDDYKGSILGMGNPLLDISARVDDDFMKKYEIRPGNAILAEPKHLPMYDELSKKEEVEYISGGSTLNTIRVCQWMVQKKDATTYFGCIGKDAFGNILSECARKDGVNCHFLIDEALPTGTCAVCLTGDKERSMVANLGAANNFKVAHIHTEKSKNILDNAKIVYTAGFFATSSPETQLEVGKHCFEHNKVFAINFSAEFIVQFFKDKIAPLIEICSHIFSNESEAIAFAKANDIKYNNMVELCKNISLIPSKRKTGRYIIITQGKDPVLIGKNGEVKEYPVQLIPQEKIVDLNGAGDAFVGGFLSQLIQNKSEKECVEAGNYAAGYIIQTSGTKLSGLPQYP